MQLLAAALVIGGDEKQQQLLSSDLLVYRWNCYFPNSGRQLVTLTIRLVEESSYTELKAIQNPVRVVKVGSLTQREVWLLACLSGGVSAMLGAIRVLQEIGVL